MAETERAKTIRQAEERIKAIKGRHGITTEQPRKKTLKPVTPKKKKKSTLRSIIERIKKLVPKTAKPKKKIDLPKIAKEDISTLREIMGRPALKEKK